MRKGTDLSPLFFFCLGVAFSIGSLRFSIWDQYGPGPGFFPLVIGVLVAVLSLAHFLQRIINKDNPAGALFRSSSKRKVIAYLMALVCFYFLFNSLGFLITIFLFMSAVPIVMGKKSLKLSISVGIFSVIFVYLIFIKLMSVPLPAGIIGPILGVY
jgi:putative tricarboxylic transport membrane protein